jgi:hypothetical protein
MSEATVLAAYEKANRLGQLFIAKGAVSPETAMTLAELGLRRKSGIFHLMHAEKHIIGHNGKYYLDAKKFQDEDVETLHELIRDFYDEETGEYLSDEEAAELLA